MDIFIPPAAIKPPATTLGSPFTNNELKIFSQALRIAWTQLPTAQYNQHLPFQLADYVDEDLITSRLVELLNNMLKDESYPWFHLGQFGTITNDSKNPTRKYGIEKMPDMTVYLRHTNATYSHLHGLFIECKVLTAGHSSQSVSEYVREGIARFVDKRYAEFTTTAMMCAYATPDFEPSRDLKDYFDRAKKRGSSTLVNNSSSGWLPYKLSSFPHEAIPSAIACCSEHQRNDPEPLRLIHLWLYHP